MSTAYLERFMVQISVGWAFPSSDELLINAHITYDLMDWTDVVDYKMLQELRRLVNNHTEEFRYVSFPTLGADEIADTIEMLCIPQYDADNVKQLEKMAKTIALWIEKILSNVGRLDEESRRLCKQLFFRSIDKLEKFDLLSAKTKVVGDGQAGGKASKDGADHSGGGGGGSGAKKRGSVMDTMGRMFMGNRTVRLNEENLERYNRTSGDTDYEPSEAGTIRTGSNPNNSNSPKAPGGRPGLGAARRATMKFFSSRASDNGVSEKPSTSSHMSIFGGGGGGGDMRESITALEVAEKSNLLRIEVQRGEEAHNGVVMYDIALKIVGKKYKTPMSFQTTHRFSHFRTLYRQLVEINQAALQGTDHNGPKRISDFMLLFTVDFPPLPMKSYLGLSLNDSELSERTRALDAWFRQVCVHYRNMPSNARQAVRQFLNFDMSQSKDIFFQDQLAWGVIEQAESSSGRPMLIVQQSVLNTVSDTMKEELGETMSAVDGQGGAAGAKAAARAKASRLTPSDARSIRSGAGEDTSQLHNLLWETASMGGTSRIPKKKAQQSRTILKKIDE